MICLVLHDHISVKGLHKTKLGLLKRSLKHLQLELDWYQFPQIHLSAHMTNEESVSVLPNDPWPPFFKLI